MNINSPCPCGSQNKYTDCCKPFHSGKLNAPTAEKLMRSRYSAFALGLVNYIHATLHPKYRDENDLEILRTTINETQWLGLQILDTYKGQLKDLRGEVEFVAKYIDKEDFHSELHERSQFKKHKGMWFYTTATNINCTLDDE